MALLSDQTQVLTYLADEQMEMRRLVRTTLRDLRFKEFKEFRDVGELRADLAFTYPDLLIIDMNLPGGDMCEVVRDIRHNRLGPNPFVPIIAMTWDKDKQSITKIIDTGVDGLILKPIAPHEITRYVEAITKDRKLFVVTSTYIGPDRRKKASRGTDDNLLEVPNTLKSKRNGETVVQSELMGLISSRLEAVNIQRLKRNAFDISMLLEVLLPRFEKNAADDITRGYLNRIHDYALDLMDRTSGTEFEHVYELCENMSTVSSSLISKLENPSRKDLKLLKPLSDAILKAFHPEKDEADLAHEIASSISNFKRFNAA